CALCFAMGLREEGVRAWNKLGKVRKKVDGDIVLIPVLKRDGFRHHLQAYKRTGEQHPLWVIEHGPGTVKERLSACRCRNEDIGIDKCANQCCSPLCHSPLRWAAISRSMSSQSRRGRPLASILCRISKSFLPKGVRATFAVVGVVGVSVFVSISTSCVPVDAPWHKGSRWRGWASKQVSSRTGSMFLVQ